MSGAVEAAARRTMRTVPFERIVLVLACVPILLGPPLAALFLIGREAMRTPGFRFIDWLTPAMIAAVNLILSVLILRHLGGELIVMLREVGVWIQQDGSASPSGVPLRGI
ncbi:hypothetical protein [Antarcticirhabdus aurantiaca]|uniref:Uncharacterized protein n=1 Tax=Antarcticirhabdus aurantiaca TaxID=2606717 RepID=A0ACD4NRZ1_9HYPH|nr:hypothetical protein [Antarcticirhabdus aurantiaca]WAJ29508.1 hypothetical protein OXU80_04540 [Jeongeuplla avenae]